MFGPKTSGPTPLTRAQPIRPARTLSLHRRISIRRPSPARRLPSLLALTAGGPAASLVSLPPFFLAEPSRPPWPFRGSSPSPHFPLSLYAHLCALISPNPAASLSARFPLPRARPGRLSNAAAINAVHDLLAPTPSGPYKWSSGCASFSSSSPPHPPLLFRSLFAGIEEVSRRPPHAFIASSSVSSAA